MDPLPTITTSDLNLRSREVLDRVARGERLIVCRRGKPLATLQPLDGYVFQPFTGTAEDVFGWPFGDEPTQVERLSPELTGRGLALREALLRMEGREEELFLV